MTPHAPQTKVTRETLYEEVWTSPVDDVAQRYGLSGRGFAKLCVRVGVPVPPRGYWAKLRAGRTVKRPPLPTVAQASDATIEIQPRSNPTSPWRARTPDQTFDSAAGELLMRIAAGEPVEVRANLRGAHPAVRHVATQVDERERERKVRGWPVDPAAPVGDVTPALRRRALLILDAIAHALDAHGIEVEPLVGGIGVRGKLLGQTFNVCVRERMRRVAVRKADRWSPRKWDMERSGKLEIRIDLGNSGDRRGWEDGATPLEKRIRDVLPRVLYWVDEVRRQQAEREREWREIEEQLRQEQEAKARRQRELERRERLLEDGAAWDRCTKARAYVAAVEQRIRERQGSIAEGSRARRWLTWAHRALDAMDPVARADRLDPVTPAEVAVPEQIGALAPHGTDAATGAGTGGPNSPS